MLSSMSEVVSEGGEAREGQAGVAGCRSLIPRDSAPLEQEEQVDGRSSTSPGPQPQITPSKRAMKRALRRQQQAAAREAKRRKKEEAQQEEREDEKEPNFTDEHLQETEYYLDNGLRKVYPYNFTYTTHAKRRWLEKNLLSVFLEEFRADTEENYRKSIETGKITVNGEKTTADYKLKDNDFIANFVHRHEVPVLAAPIQILENTDDVLVVNKPSSIPVHPCGRYRHNSLTYILAKQYGHRHLRSIHRIDRLTSGLLIFGKTEKKTRELMDHVKNRLIEKEYLCRVVGEFPSEPIECDEPINVLSRKLGLFKCCDEGKDACTLFQRISYNGRTSVVKCRPYTGRTHQIRVHLQFLGYPIVNDPIYNGDVWGPNRGKDGIFGKSEEQLIEDLTQLHSRERHQLADDQLSTVTQAESSSSSGKESDLNSDTSGSISVEDGGQSRDLEDSVSSEDKPPNSVHNSSGSSPSRESSKDSENNFTSEDSVELASRLEVSKIDKEENGVVTDTENRTSSEMVSNVVEGSAPSTSSSDSMASKDNSSDLNDNAKASGSDSPSDRGNAKASSEDSKSSSNDSKEANVNSKASGVESKEADVNSKASGVESSAPAPGNVMNIPGGDSVPAGMPQMPGPIAMMRMQFDMLISASFPGDGPAGSPAPGLMGMPGIPGMSEGIPEKESSDSLPHYDPSKLSMDPDCVECKKRYRDPKPKELIMYLHAYRYKGPNWEYSTDVPEWAMADWQEPES